MSADLAQLRQQLLEEAEQIQARMSRNPFKSDDQVMQRLQGKYDGLTFAMLALDDMLATEEASPAL